MTIRNGASKEVAALVQHIELHRAGWWEATIQRLALAAIWLNGHTASEQQVAAVFEEQFHCSLGTARLRSTLESLGRQNLVIQLPTGAWRIPEVVQQDLEREIREAEGAEALARESFLACFAGCNVDASSLWNSFSAEFLGPLINQTGASTYHLLVGENLDIDEGLASRFLKQFDDGLRDTILTAISQFLDPSNVSARGYVSRMLHARFCVDAGGLPDGVIQKLNESLGRQVRFRVFIDTNLLFSLLEIHENPSNAAARDLKEIVDHLDKNPRVQLYVTPQTLDEAKRSVAWARANLAEVPGANAFSTAAIKVGVSGIADRFFSERLARSGQLSAEDWFEPYLRDLVTIVRGKGIELFNEKLDPYSMRQDVIDDIQDVLSHQQRAQPGRQKSYEQIAHDVILWHFVNDKRAAYLESPIEATDWVLTLDYRLIGFDAFKRKQLARNIPVCLHPVTFIQLLQLWVPRTAEFEEAMLGSMRLPFLFRQFDAAAEKTTLRILAGLGRYAGGSEMSEATISGVLLNEGLRARLEFGPPPDSESEIVLIRDALVEEMQERIKEEEASNRALAEKLKSREAALEQLSDANKVGSGELDALRGQAAQAIEAARLSQETILRQAEEIAGLKRLTEDDHRARALRGAWIRYCSVLAVLLVTTAGAVWLGIRSPIFTGALTNALAVAALGTSVFSGGHAFLERWWRTDSAIQRVPLLPLVRGLRKCIATVVFGGLVLGVIGNLLSDGIQKERDAESVTTSRATEHK